MANSRKPTTPKLCKHPDGRAYVRIRGKFHYLGKYGTPEAVQRYHALMAEVAATGMVTPPSRQPKDITVAEALDQYLDFAADYYRTDSGRGGQVDRIRAVSKVAGELYGDLPAAEFSPLKLKAIQTELVKLDYARQTINAMTGCLKRAFKWLAANELIPAHVAVSLSVVEGLRFGKTEARETEPVKPVALEDVERTLPFLPGPLQAMVRLQLATACRPGEVTNLRPCDVDTSKEVWEIRLKRHKTAYRGKERVIYVGPQGQAILRPYLLRAPEAYCFSPRDAIAERAAQAETHRRPNQKPNPSKTNRTVGDRYTTLSYCRAVQRAVEKADRKAKREGLPPVNLWSPNQLRHTRATEIRKVAGLEAAQILLGHARADVTQVYAERDAAKAVEIVARIG